MQTRTFLLLRMVSRCPVVDCARTSNANEITSNKPTKKIRNVDVLVWLIIFLARQFRLMSTSIIEFQSLRYAPPITLARKRDLPSCVPLNVVGECISVTVTQSHTQLAQGLAASPVTTVRCNVSGQDSLSNNSDDDTVEPPAFSVVR